MKSYQYEKVDIKNKVVLVTGASSGIGKATASLLNREDAIVVLMARSEERGKAALQEMQAEYEGQLHLMLCDLADLSSIQNFVEEFQAKFDHLDILINNAGFISLDRQETVDGFERQFGVNHLGHFYLTLALVKMMPKKSRIINVSSGAHKIGKIHFEDLQLKKNYHVMKAYGQSKLANILFTRELAQRLKPYEITVNAVYPGAVATEMGVNRDTQFGRKLVASLKPFFLTPELGAATSVYAATAYEMNRVTGAYLYQCEISKTSKAAKNRSDAIRLFEESERLTGISFKKE